jgi:hypothetical protein
MKLEIIEKLDYWLAVSDEEIKKDDIIFYHHPKQSFDMASIHKVINPNYSLDEPAYRVKFDTGWGVIEGCKQIIAYQPKGNAPELDLPLLPEIVVEPRGFDEFEYTEEDLRKAIEMARGIKEGKETFTAEDIAGCTEVCTYDWKFEFDEDEIIKSLKQPKTPKWFVAETVPNFPKMPINGKDFPFIDVLKTTKNSEGKQVLVGTYLNE